MKENERKPTARMMLGKKGEDVACRFLRSIGHRIIKRNYRVGHLEIDIISEDGNGLHFVEVKSRMEPVSATPEENVTALKQKKIANAALRFLNTYGSLSFDVDKEVFFDIVAVTFCGGNEKVEWFPNAFVPMYC